MCDMMRVRIHRGISLGILFLLSGGVASAAVNTYVVPAISDTKLLPAMAMDGYSQGTNIPVTATPGERTSVSFVVRSDAAISSFTVESSAFTNGTDTLPAGIAAIRILKCWYQAGYNNADYLSANYLDPSLDTQYLTPELLLHDNSLVEVEGDDWTQWNVVNPNGRNYLRLKNGTMVDVSTAAVQQIDNNNILDADTLQPADLDANYNRQYVITFTIPANAKPGDYSGTMTLKSTSTTFGTMNIALKVLPFALPASPLEYTIYFQASINAASAINTYSVPENIWISYLQNMLSHGITNPMMYPSSDAVMTRELELRRQYGMSNAHLYYHHDGPLTDYDHLKTLFAPYGVARIYNYGPDENQCDRNQILEEHANGYGHFNAQSTQTANEVPDVLDLALIFGTPLKSDATLYHRYGNRVFTYGNPQTVPEWPRIFRHNYGLLLWQNDFDGAAPFAYDSYAGDAWNDFSDTDMHNRGHMFIYPTGNGVVDTIHWEGFAEGTNDVKYAAALQNAIKSMNAPTNATVIAAQAYLNTLKTADLSTADLDAVRAQLQTHILALYNLGADPTTTVAKTTPVINWSAPADIAFGTALSGTQLNATASAAGTFVYTPAAGIVLSGGAHTLRVDFTPTDVDNYTTASKEVTIMVIKNSPVVAWYDNAYLFRKTITIAHSKISNTDQSNFPVLVSLTSNDIKTGPYGVQNSNGYDIAFTDENNTKLDHEIERYDSATGALTAWVKVPLLSPSSDSIIHMYYGNNGISSSQENPAGVWGNGYSGVWHFKETGTDPTMNDSTGNGNNSTSQTWTPVAGQIGGAAGFNGTSQYGVVADSTCLRPSDDFTYSLWVKPSAGNSSVFEKGIAFSGYGLRMATGYRIFAAGWGMVAPFGMTVDASQWHYVTVTFKRPDVLVYYDGIQYGRGPVDASSGSPGIPLTIGGIYSYDEADGYQSRPEFNGSLDELRFANVFRSADWIRTEYNNQSSPSTFYSVGNAVNLNSLKCITAFNFNGLSPAVTGIIDENSHTVSLTVPGGTDVTALVPTITIVGASVSPTAGVPQDFTNPVLYTVTAVDGSTQTYTVTVNVTATGAGTSTCWNYPNPVNFARTDRTTIAYTVANASSVSIKIFSLSGQLVKTLVNDQTQPAGKHFDEWRGETDGAGTAASGVYLCVTKIGNDVIKKKIVLVR